MPAFSLSQLACQSFPYPKHTNTTADNATRREGRKEWKTYLADSLGQFEQLDTFVRSRSSEQTRKQLFGVGRVSLGTLAVLVAGARHAGCVGACRQSGYVDARAIRLGQRTGQISIGLKLAKCALHPFPPSCIGGVIILKKWNTFPSISYYNASRNQYKIICTMAIYSQSRHNLHASFPPGVIVFLNLRSHLILNLGYRPDSLIRQGSI